MHDTHNKANIYGTFFMRDTYFSNLLNSHILKRAAIYKYIKIYIINILKKLRQRYQLTLFKIQVFKVK